MPHSHTPSAAADRPRETRFVEMVFPEHANHYGTLFGGNALSLMGKAAFVAATRYSRAAVVLKSSDKVAFLHPIKVGEIAEITARITDVGQYAMTVTVDVVAEALITGRRHRAISGSFEMVSVDDAGHPTPINTPDSHSSPTVPSKKDILS